MEYTPSQFDGLLAQIKTLLSILNPIQGVTSELFNKGVLSAEERDEIQKLHREQEGRDERAAGKTLVEILELKRDAQTLRGLVQAQDAFLRLYEQVQSNNDNTKECVEATDQRVLNAFQHGHLTASELQHLLETCCTDCNIRDITNFEGKSLLHLACCSMLLNTVSLLIEQYHFDPSMTDNDGNTPLHDACRCRKVEIVKYLLKVPNCDPNVRNNDGNTALHESVFLKHWGVCRALLSSENVECTVRNNDGLSPFEWLDQHPQFSREGAKLKRVLSNRCRTSGQNDQNSNHDRNQKGQLVDDSKQKHPQRSLSKPRKGLLRSTAIEMDDMDSVLMTVDEPDSDEQNSMRIHLSVAFWDACISVSFTTCILGSSLLVAMAIIAALIYLLATTI